MLGLALAPLLDAEAEVVAYFSVKIELLRSVSFARLAASGRTGCLTTFWWIASTSG